MPNLVSLVCVVGSQGPRFPCKKNNKPLPSFCSTFEFFIKTPLLQISQCDVEPFISIAFAYGYGIFKKKVFILYYCSVMFGIEIEGDRNTVFQSRGRNHVNKEEDVTEK